MGVDFSLTLGEELEKKMLRRI